jgi:hypothetical protein
MPISCSCALDSSASTEPIPKIGNYATADHSRSTIFLQLRPSKASTPTQNRQIQVLLRKALAPSLQVRRRHAGRTPRDRPAGSCLAGPWVAKQNSFRSKVFRVPGHHMEAITTRNCSNEAITDGSCVGSRHSKGRESCRPSVASSVSLRRDVAQLRDRLRGRVDGLRVTCIRIPVYLLSWLR